MFLTLKHTLIGIVLPFLYIFFLSLIAISSIILLYSPAFIFYDDYSQSIEAGTELFNILFLSNMLPIAHSKRLTKIEKEAFWLPEELKQILVGLILGDLNVQKQTKNSNVRLCFKQGLVHKEYLMHLYELFKTYSPALPKTTNPVADKRTGNTYIGMWFNTYSLPCFNIFYDMFYLDGKKIIPLNIGDMFTPLSLAYLVADDGGFCKSTKRIRLSTNSFTLEEVNLLVAILNNRWNLNCAVYNNNGHVISIPAKSLPVVQTLLSPVMPSVMLHKIGLSGGDNL